MMKASLKLKRSAPATTDNTAPSSSLDVVTAIATATKQLLAAQDAETFQTAARAVAAACANSEDEEDIAARRGAFRTLAEMLRASHGEAEAGALALWKLTGNSKNQNRIVTARAIRPLVALLRNGTDAAKANAAGVLEAFAWNDDNIMVAIVRAGAIPPLVALLQIGTDIAKENAAGVLWDLVDHNKVSIVSAGAIPPLVALLQIGTDMAKENAAGVLSELAANNDNKVSIAKAGAIPLLVALIESGYGSAKENAAGTLRDLSRC